MSGLTLAFDTSTRLGSVAIAEGGVVQGTRYLTRQRDHAAGLLPAVQDLLDSVGANPGDIRHLIVGAGPGSFTGVRVAAASAKGFVHSLRVPLYALSSLAAGAVSVGVSVRDDALRSVFGSLESPSDGGPIDPGAPRAVLFDARGTRLFAACYREADGLLEELVSPHATDLETVLAGEMPSGAVFMGDGALRHAGAIESTGRPVAPLPAGLPTAEGLLRLERLTLDLQPERNPAGWQPEYLKAWATL